MSAMEKMEKVSEFVGVDVLGKLNEAAKVGSVLTETVSDVLHRGLRSPEEMLVRGYMETVRAENTAGERAKFMRTLSKDVKMMGLVLAKIKELKAMCTDESRVLELADKFEWTSDPVFGAYDYSPDLMRIGWDLVKYGKVKDDCDGSARFAQYLYWWLADNTKKVKLVAEYCLCPKPVKKGLKDSHVVLVIRESAGKYKVLSNGRLYMEGAVADAKPRYFGSIQEIGDWFASSLKETTGCIVAPVPVNNMDEYLSRRYFGDAI